MQVGKNEKLKSHFCHTKGNRLKLNKTTKLNFCSRSHEQIGEMKGVG
jgi:hypothetical protein